MYAGSYMDVFPLMPPLFSTADEDPFCVNLFIRILICERIKNGFNCCLQVLFLDPIQEESIELVKLAELFYKHNIPLRYVHSTIAFNTFYLSHNIFSVFLIFEVQFRLVLKYVILIVNFWVMTAKLYNRPLSQKIPCIALLFSYHLIVSYI